MGCVLDVYPHKIYGRMYVQNLDGKAGAKTPAFFIY